MRDFSVIFDAYARFEDAMITVRFARRDWLFLTPFAHAHSMDAQAKMTMMEESDEADLEADSADVDLRLMRLSYLMERRPILLSSVLLRQNPHNVHEWHNRVNIFKKLAEEDPARNKDVITTYTEAVKTVRAALVVGFGHGCSCDRLPDRWTTRKRSASRTRCGLVSQNSMQDTTVRALRSDLLLWLVSRAIDIDDLRKTDLANAEVIFDKATEEEFRFMDDVAQVGRFACASGRCT